MIAARAWSRSGRPAADPPPRSRAVCKLIDTTSCIGCKACEVACQEWNDLAIEPTASPGDYQTLPGLTPEYWNLILFRETERDGQFQWLMRKHQCLHCAEPGCLLACPSPGAIIQYENGVVRIDPDRCIGCGYCTTGCPFDVPRLDDATGKATKCTLCADRVAENLEPACVKSCPTGCLHFGTWDDMKALADRRVERLHEAGRKRAGVYGDDLPGVGGRAGVLYVLGEADRPGDYKLPEAPSIHWALRTWKGPLKGIGWAVMGLALVGVAVQHLRFGGRAAEAPAAEEEVPRHPLWVRLNHWISALSCALLVVTGLPLFSPVFSWMADWVGGGSMARFLHPWAGVVFSATILLMFASWTRSMWPNRGDVTWLRHMRNYITKRGPVPDSGKFNAGQKAFFWALIGLTAALLASGIVLWIPASFGVTWRVIALGVHDAAFILLVCGLVSHVYMSTLGLPGTLRAMIRGSVAKSWAEHHHKLWTPPSGGKR